MVTELPTGNEGEPPESYGEDPEVPLIPHAHEASSAKHKPNKYASWVGNQARMARETLVIFARYVLKRAKRAIASASFWTATATVAIAFATAVYTHYAGRQWDVMERQLSDLEAYQRANLVMETFEADWPNQDSSIQIHCIIWNAGQTTALSMSIGTGGGGGGRIPLDKNGNRTLPVIAVSGVPNPSDYGPSLAPNQRRDCGWTQQLGTNDRDYISAVWMGDVVQTFTIEISYKDVFGKSWIINDCLAYWVKNRGSGTGRFAHCPIKPQ